MIFKDVIKGHSYNVTTPEGFGDPFNTVIKVKDNDGVTVTAEWESPYKKHISEMTHGVDNGVYLLRININSNPFVVNEDLGVI